MSVGSYGKNPNPVILMDMRQASDEVALDTRGLDLTLDLNNPDEPLNDPAASIDAVTVIRVDGQAITANDLTITPSGSVAPWLTTVKLGAPTSTGFFANWWQGVNFAIAANGPVLYQITVEATTVAGRKLAWDAYQRVVAAIG